MDSSSSKILKLLLVIYIIGIIVSLYFIYILPSSLESSSLLISPEAIEEAYPTLLKVNAIVIVTLLIGLTHVVISSQNKARKEVIEKVVYVEKKSDENIKNEDEETLNKNDKEKIEEIIANVKSKKTLQSKQNAIINEICNKLEASQGIFYVAKESGNKKVLQMASSFAYSLRDSSELIYEFGEGLAGQAAKQAKTMKVNEIPEDYMEIVSGLGNAQPKYLLLQPVMVDNDVEALIELASFKEFTHHDERVISEVVNFLGSDLKDTTNKTEEKKSVKKTKSSSKEN